jgi:hypothetical protein
MGVQGREAFREGSSSLQGGAFLWSGPLVVHRDCAQAGVGGGSKGGEGAGRIQGGVFGEGSPPRDIPPGSGPKVIGWFSAPLVTGRMARARVRMAQMEMRMAVRRQGRGDSGEWGAGVCPDRGCRGSVRLRGFFMGFFMEHRGSAFSGSTRLCFCWEHKARLGSWSNESTGVGLTLIRAWLVRGQVSILGCYPVPLFASVAIFENSGFRSGT